MATITVNDSHDLGYCNKGVRAFFARHELSWRDFIRNGIETDKVEHIDDAMARKLIEYAKKKEGEL
jgi:uncharacterized protein YllA (UPF0747 family)